MKMYMKSEELITIIYKNSTMKLLKNNSHCCCTATLNAALISLN